MNLPERPLQPPHPPMREPDDPDDLYDRAIQREIDAAADILREEWWLGKLGGLSIADDTASCMARVMVNLDAACRGDPISRDAVFTALSNLQKVARKEALEEL